MVTSCSTGLLDSYIEDATSMKKILVSEMDSVMNLLREVESEEKAVEQAKEEAARSSIDVLVKLDKLKQAQHAQETNDMLVRKVHVQKAALATETELLRLQMAKVLDDGDTTLALLDQIHGVLEMRLLSALATKRSTNSRRQENEAFGQVALAYQEMQMEKMALESKELEKEVAECSKLQELIIDRGHLVHSLRLQHELLAVNILPTYLGGISSNCDDVKLLKQQFDQAIPPLSGLSPVLISCQRKAELNGNLKEIADHVQSADQEQIKGNDFGENSSDAGTREVTKLRGNRVVSRRIKKLKIRGLRVGSKMRRAADNQENVFDVTEMAAFTLLYIMVISLVAFNIVFYYSEV